MHRSGAWWLVFGSLMIPAQAARAEVEPAAPTTLAAAEPPLAAADAAAPDASPTMASDAAPTQPAVPARAAATQGSGIVWGLPPVLLNGSVAYDLRVDRIEDGPRRVQHLLGLQLNATTFLYAPWLATLGLSLGLTQSRSASADQPDADLDRFITGGLRLHVFPRSRFPFEARYETADSRTDSSLLGGFDYRSRTLALAQRYRPESGAFSISATYERRSQDSEAFGEDTQEALLGDFNTSWKRHHLSASVARSVNRRRSTAEEAEFTSAVARHSYGYGNGLSVETSANWAESDEQLLTGPEQIRVAQWSSVALWRPEAVAGLTVTGSARGFSLDSEGDFVGTSTDSLGLGAGATYEVNRNLRLAANSTMTRVDGALSETIWVASAGASWQGDTIRLGDYQYDWNTGVSASRASSDHDGAEDEQSVSGAVGHTLGRVWLLPSTATVAASLGQSLSVTRSSGALFAGAAEDDDGHSRSLSHSASLTWSASGVDRSAYARLSFADARQFDGDRAHFQLMNLQVSGSYEVDRNRSWSGDITVQRVLQRSMPLGEPQPFDPFGPSRITTQSASGELSWRQLRVFGVPRLRYTSRLRLSHDTQRQRSALLPLPDRETASWENRLDYQIGRLETALALRVAQIDGSWRQLLLFRVQRNFGD